MPNWRTIVLDDLQAAAVSGKVVIIRNAAAARTLPDPAPAAIANVTLELRSVLGFSGRYVPDEDATKLPSSLLDLAIKKIVREMSWAISLPFSDEDKSDERTYEARLEKIRLGEWPIETADNPIATPTVQTSTVTPSITPRPRQFDRSTAY